MGFPRREPGKLSTIEFKVWFGLALARTDKQIAASLGTNVSTIRGVIRRLVRHLDVPATGHTRIALALAFYKKTRRRIE